MAQFNIKKVNRYLDMAKEASTQSDFNKHHLGAVAIYHGSLLATGFNSCKTSPIQKRYNKARSGFDTEADYKNSNSLHAEMSCILKIRNLDIDFSKTTIFVYRQTKNGQKALSRPCEACSAALKKIGIKDVYYTIKDGWEHIHWD